MMLMYDAWLCVMMLYYDDVDHADDDADNVW